MIFCFIFSAKSRLQESDAASNLMSSLWMLGESDNDISWDETDFKSDHGKYSNGKSILCFQNKNKLGESNCVSETIFSIDIEIK